MPGKPRGPNKNPYRSSEKSRERSRTAVRKSQDKIRKMYEAKLEEAKRDGIELSESDFESDIEEENQPTNKDNNTITPSDLEMILSKSVKESLSAYQAEILEQFKALKEQQKQPPSADTGKEKNQLAHNYYSNIMFGDY